MTGSNAFFNRSSPGSDAGKWSFAFRAAMAQVRTTVPVKVVAVHGGGLGLVGRVDVQPLVQQTDSAGNVMSLPVLYGLPYLRWQGGQSAVILDPAVGDIGLVCFADRDVSAVVSTGKLSPPGSNRRFSLADGFYVGATLNAQPTQYLQFDPTSGVILNSPTAIKAQIGTDANAARLVMNGSGLVLSFGGHSITINNSGVAISGPVTVDNTATFAGEVMSGSIGLQAHHHTAQGATAPTTPAQA